MDAQDLSPDAHIYTFVGDDGESINIASGLLREWCLKAGPEIFWVPMNRPLAETFARENVISLARVRQLEALGLDPTEIEPVIFCKTGTIAANGGPDVVLADGHHRFYLQRAEAMILAYVLEMEQWSPFRITSGLREVTEEELRQHPIFQRNYWK